MISAPIGKSIDFPIQRQAARQPAVRRGWLLRIAQRMQQRHLANACCLLH